MIRKKISIYLQIAHFLERISNKRARRTTLGKVSTHVYRNQSKEIKNFRDVIELHQGLNKGKVVLLLKTSLGRGLTENFVMI